MSWVGRISVLAGLLFLGASQSTADQQPVPQLPPPNQFQSCTGSLYCPSMYVLNGCYFTAGRVPMCVNSQFNPQGCNPSLVSGYVCTGVDDFDDPCSQSFSGCV